MKMAQFFQEGPELRNQYDSDSVLKGYLKRIVPAAILTEIESDRWCAQKLFALRRESPEYLAESKGLSLSKDSAADV
jgi:hypothetical protein